MSIGKSIIIKFLSSMSVRICLLIQFILIINTFDLISANYTIIMPDGKSSSLNSEFINNKDYVQLSQISEHVFAGSVYYEEVAEIISTDFRIKVAPASFFVLLEKDHDIKVSQMNLPTLNYNNNVIVPLESFFRSLENLNLFRISLRENTIILTLAQPKIIKQKFPKLASKKIIGIREIETVKKPSVDLMLEPIPFKDNDSDAFRDTQKAIIKSGNHIIDGSNEIQNDTFLKKEIKPDYYIIPDGLIRRDLDRAKESKKKIDSIKSDILELEKYYYYLNSSDCSAADNGLFASLDIDAPAKVNIIDIFTIKKKILPSFIS